MTNVDETDYALLAAIADADRPVWKKRLHTKLHDSDPPLPGKTDLSLQSVGRRINALHEDGLVDTEVVESSEVSQNLIIGYRLTDKGRRVLEKKRGEILGSYAGQTGRDLEFMEQDTLLRLLADELDLTEAEYEMLEEQDVEALYIFTMLYHALRLADGMLDAQTEKAFFNVIKHNRERNHGAGYTALLQP